MVPITVHIDIAIDWQLNSNMTITHSFVFRLFLGMGLATLVCLERANASLPPEKVAALKEIASKIPAEDSALIFTVSLSISEEQFATLEECEHPALGEILLARTVSYSAFSAKPVKAKG